MCIAGDMPTGAGVMPRSVIKSIYEIALLTELSAVDTIGLATGGKARASCFQMGTIEVSARSDLVVCDGPSASMADDAPSAIARGDIPGISCVIIDGEVKVARNCDTPLAKRLAWSAGAVVASGGH